MIVGVVTEIVLDWHTEQNKANRDAAGCCKWLREQACGGYISHVNKIAQCLANGGMLEKVGFLLSPESLRSFMGIGTS